MGACSIWPTWLVQCRFGSWEEPFFSSVCDSLLRKLRIGYWTTRIVDWSKESISTSHQSLRTSYNLAGAPHQSIGASDLTTGAPHSSTEIYRNSTEAHPRQSSHPSIRLILSAITCHIFYASKQLITRAPPIT